MRSSQTCWLERLLCHDASSTGATTPIQACVIHRERTDDRSAGVQQDRRDQQAVDSLADIAIEEVGSAFERLAWSLVDVSKEDDAALRGSVIDIERIRFTQRQENWSSPLPARRAPASA